MSTGKFLGKIAKAKFGFFDDNPAQELGLSVELAFETGNTNTFVEVSLLRKYMVDAKVTDVTKMLGKPVSVEIKENVLQRWRILTEVL